MLSNVRAVYVITIARIYLYNYFSSIIFRTSVPIFSFCEKMHLFPLSLLINYI